MYERLSPRAKRVIQLANDIAREEGKEYVGTEHVLLAILREGDGVGAKVLAGRNVTEEKLKVEVHKLVESNLEKTWVFGRLPGSPHYFNVVATAIEQAQQLESREVCSEHILLALAKEKGSVAHSALANIGIHHADIRREVLEHAG